MVRGVAPGVLDRRAQALREEAADLTDQIEQLEGEIDRVLDKLAETVDAVARQAGSE